MDRITRVVEVPTIDHVNGLPNAAITPTVNAMPSARMPSRIHPSLGSCSLAIR